MECAAPVIDRTGPLTSIRSRDLAEPQLAEPRLLSPERAAAYLGLRSRFAVYRLVASGQVPALRLANKLRIDIVDLDTLIENAKAAGPSRARESRGKAPARRPVPRQLAPRHRRKSVTPPVTVSQPPAKPPEVIGEIATRAETLD